MRDEQIAKDVVTGAALAVKRWHDSQPKNVGEVNLEVMAAYLSGCSQTTHFLIRMDGEVSIQQMDRAVLQAGKLLGFTSGPAT